MSPITLELLRKRAEHNGGIVATLEARSTAPTRRFGVKLLTADSQPSELLTRAPVSQEVALHGQDIERIELLGHACRELRILYLQNNVIGRIGAFETSC